MKQRLLDKLSRMGYGNLSKRTLSVAFILWLLPLGTIWSIAFLFVHRLLSKRNRYQYFSTPN
jgi:hypothetical protein